MKMSIHGAALEASATSLADDPYALSFQVDLAEAILDAPTSREADEADEQLFMETKALYEDSLLSRIEGGS